MSPVPSPTDDAKLLKPPPPEPTNTRRLRHNTPRAKAIAWLTPGLRIKRWGVIGFLGLGMAAVGAALMAAYIAVDFSLWVLEVADQITGRLIDTVALGAVFFVAGVCLVAVGLRGTLRAVERAYEDAYNIEEGFLEVASKNKQLTFGPKIVVLGGGTGLSTMLRGLKAYSSNITAVVTMADDGGSSGMLREHGMLPPGDLRNCIAALAEAEPTMQRLFQHRFTGLGELKGHSLGNLVVAAMYEMTGDFESAVRETSKVLAIRGQVLPSTLDDIRLGARLEDGTEVIGQVEVNKVGNIEQVFIQPESPSALPGVIRAIGEADVIIIGPGSLYTSIIPNLLVPEIAAAVRSAKAPKVYVCNVMTQPKETTGYTASHHVRALIRHIGPGVINYVLLNNGKVNQETLDRYLRVGAEYVVPDENAIEMMNVRPIHGNFIDDTNVVRHNPQRLAECIFRVLSRL